MHWKKQFLYNIDLISVFEMPPWANKLDLVKMLLALIMIIVIRIDRNVGHLMTAQLWPDLIINLK